MDTSRKWQEMMSGFGSSDPNFVGIIAIKGSKLNGINEFRFCRDVIALTNGRSPWIECQRFSAWNNKLRGDIISVWRCILERQELSYLTSSFNHRLFAPDLNNYFLFYVPLIINSFTLPVCERFSPSRCHPPQVILSFYQVSYVVKGETKKTRRRRRGEAKDRGAHPHQSTIITRLQNNKTNKRKEVQRHWLLHTSSSSSVSLFLSLSLSHKKSSSTVSVWELSTPKHYYSLYHPSIHSCITNSTSSPPIFHQSRWWILRVILNINILSSFSKTIILTICCTSFKRSKMWSSLRNRNNSNNNMVTTVLLAAFHPSWYRFQTLFAWA